MESAEKESESIVQNPKKYRSVAKEKTQGQKLIIQGTVVAESRIEAVEIIIAHPSNKNPIIHSPSRESNNGRVPKLNTSQFQNANNVDCSIIQESVEEAQEVVCMGTQPEEGVCRVQGGRDAKTHAELAVGIWWF